MRDTLYRNCDPNEVDYKEIFVYDIIHEHKSPLKYLRIYTIEYYDIEDNLKEHKYHKFMTNFNNWNETIIKVTDSNMTTKDLYEWSNDD